MSDDDLADRWETTVDKAVRSLLTMPERGAPCRLRSLQLGGLRWIPVIGFPKHMIFYRFERDDELVYVVHVLHGARDLQAILHEEDVAEGS